ncbi:MAG: membrane dipeptidase [Spirochaetaceae bacterium]|nr:membrane dipeptidase [Spirochaetaceae bacterium]
MHRPFVIDLHLDLAWDALFWNRDLTLDVAAMRALEEAEPPQVSPEINTGICTVTVPELRRGRVGLVLSTIMSRIQSRDGHMRDGMRTQEQAMAMGRGHLAYYRTLHKRGLFKPVLGVADLDEALATWRDPTDEAAAAAPIYHLLSMESADPIEDPDDVAFWWDAGLRVVGPAHFGDNTYIHGTGTEGGLKPPAADLYRAMREAGMILDITHMADQAVWESFDLWDGPVMASHCTCRALVPGQRHLHDDMIRELVRRGGIIGLVFCQSFIDPEIDWENRRRMYESGWKPRYAMDGLLPHVERIGDLAGGTIANIAIGTDMDGGFGAELTPTDVDTIADVGGFGEVLRTAGYGQAGADAVLHGNALRFFRESWAD